MGKDNNTSKCLVCQLSRQNHVEMCNETLYHTRKQNQGWPFTFAIWTHQLSSLCGLSLFLQFLTCSSREPWLLSCVTSCRLAPGQIPWILTMFTWSKLPIVIMCCSRDSVIEDCEMSTFDLWGFLEIYNWKLSIKYSLSVGCRYTWWIPKTTQGQSILQHKQMNKSVTSTRLYCKRQRTNLKSWFRQLQNWYFTWGCHSGSLKESNKSSTNRRWCCKEACYKPFRAAFQAYEWEYQAQNNL